MIRFRPFHNTDPPALAELWQSQPPTRGRLPRVTPQLLEQLVFSRIYFDAAGLIVAQENERLRGFAHAGFGPGPEGGSISTQQGAVSLLMAAPGDGEAELAAELLRRAEGYLVERGAQEIYGGAHGELAPFYVGLYGGSGLPGILHSDAAQQRYYHAAQYAEISQISVQQRALADFRPPMNREQLQLRRKLRAEVVVDPPPLHWWQACRMAQHEQTCLRLLPLDRSGQAGALWYWNMEPLSSSWGVHAAGITRWEVAGAAADASIESFLLSETLRHLQSQGVTLVETQVGLQKSQTLTLLAELGFREVDRGVVFRRGAAGE